MTRTDSAPAGLGQCSCTALRRAAREVSHLYDSTLAPTGLRVSQLSLLIALNALGGASVNELAQHLGLDRTTTGKNLRPLQRDGLVAIARSGRDGRSRAVSLTSAGRGALARAVPLWQEAQHALERKNGREALMELHGLLARLTT